MAASATIARIGAAPSGPHSLDAEQCLLGCLLFDNRLLDDLADDVTSEMFFEPFHGRVFARMVDAAQDGRRSDALTIFNALGQDASLAQLGGQRYLLNMVDAAPATALAREYATVVRRHWQRREMIAAGERMIVGAKTEADPEEVLTDVEADLVAIRTTSVEIDLVTAAQAVQRVYRQLDNPSAAYGVATGLEGLDEATGGFMPGELWLLAGRPGAGKSAIASSVSLHVAMNGRGASGEPQGVIEICSEMTIEQMMRRHIADQAYVMFGRDAPSYSSIRQRKISAAQRRMVRDAGDLIQALGTLRVLYRSGLTVRALRGLIRRQKAAWERQGIGTGLVVMDHMGLVVSSERMRSRSEAQGEVARDTKRVAADLMVPFLGLVQLSRKVEERDDHRPILSDLRDSGEFEESADGVIGVYREAYYAQRQPEPKRHDLKLLWDERRSSPFVDAIFMKIREGEAQTVRLWADMGRNAIRGHAPDNIYRAPLVDLTDPDVPLPPSTYNGEFD